MKTFNLSEWALNHRALVWYAMIAVTLAGVFSYLKLGREEDPNFTVKLMVIQANWPGATVTETQNQITDRIEKELQQIDTLDFTKSYTRPGQTTVFVNLKDTTRGRAIADSFYQIRKHINDIANQFPSGIQGPFFNDEFGDTYGNLYAFTADGLTQRQLRDYVEQVRTEIMTVPSLGKITLIGTQDEAIYLEFSTRKVAGLGLNTQAVIDTLQAQNAITPSGVIQAGPERVSVRITGQFTSEDSLKSINLRVNDRFFRLSDVATITRGYKDPPDALFRFNGRPAIGMGIAMQASGNLETFGAALSARMKKLTADLPVGVGVHLVSDQPAVVHEAVSGFTQALVEAILIVLAVSFVSLGVRAGFVVAFSIPLVLAAVFVYMEYSGISLQRISLGALIIALGLLVDDAMITVEMMVTRLEHGDSREQAATFAYTSTAFPMLTGTLVTVAGFIPIGLNSSSAGEYTFTLFVVIACSLLLSWIVAVVFAPLIGVTILPKTMKHKSEKPGRLAALFSGMLLRAMRWKWVTIGTALGLLALAIFGMGLVQQQFFPSSDRPELLVDVTLPQNATIRETQAQMDGMETILQNNPDVLRWSSYVGQGAIRFLLSLDPQLANPFYGQMVVVTKNGMEGRQRVANQLNRLAREKFVGTDVFVHALELGPPVGRPVQYRVSGPDVQGVRQSAIAVAQLVSVNPHVGAITFDWNEPGKVLRIDIAQDKARQLGVTSESVASIVNGVVGGSTITQVRDSIYLVPVVARAGAAERNSIDTLESLQIATQNGTVVPLLSFASVHYDLEQPIVWRRDRLPTITVQASIADDTQPATIVRQLAPGIADFEKTLPATYKVDIGGAVEAAGKGQSPIVGIVPIMLFAMATLLMIQLQSFSKLFLVVSVAPLGLVGVVAALLLSGKPLGFVAILGVLALIGIIIRNSVILISQIDEYLLEGRKPWDAVREATEHRMRPILLTAAAASLGMIPIAREVFWAPMAFAMIGGIVAATLLTLFFLPALYVACYRIKETKGDLAAAPQ